MKASHVFRFIILVALIGIMIYFLNGCAYAKVIIKQAKEDRSHCVIIKGDWYLCPDNEFLEYRF